MFRALTFLSIATLITISASAEILPVGTFSLQKGAASCPASVQLEENLKCGGLVMHDLTQKVDTSLCNINNGKYIRAWKEEGIEFFAESKTKLHNNLIEQLELVRAKKDKKILRRSKTELSLNFKKETLKLHRTRNGKDLVCRYQKNPNLPASATVIIAE